MPRSGNFPNAVMAAPATTIGSPLIAASHRWT
jgi:hypothetical protein